MKNELATFNNALLQGLSKGEAFFYTNLINHLDKEIGATCYILRPRKKTEFSIYSKTKSSDVKLDLPQEFLASQEDDPLENETMKEMIITQLNNQDLNTVNIDINQIDSRVILKTVRSIENNNNVAAIMLVQRPKLSPVFSELDVSKINYYKELLKMSISLIDYDKKLKRLVKKNTALTKMHSFHFPNNQKYGNEYVVPKKNSQDVVYLVLDVRNSSSLNEYLVARGGLSDVSEFYKSFKRYCDEIVVESHDAWFRRQIGDRMDYAWPRRKRRQAILASIKILEKINSLRRKNKIPLELGIGIGLSLGEIDVDYDINELKGDPPRIANELQEKRYGLYLDFKPGPKTTNEIEELGWLVINKSIVARGKIREVWEVRKKTRQKLNIQKENTIEQLKFANRLYQDTHLHLEGTNLKKVKYMELFEQAAKYIHKDRDLRHRLEKVTNSKIEQIIDEFLASFHTEADIEKFSFTDFLSQMYSTKIILSSKYSLINKFVRMVLDEYYNKYWNVRLGITPSIPVDFPHLNA
ncbi:MAG: hypothetical protein KDC90_19160, partial [Ignavibacteriae bacterium]|nr:hypothetical protein [Ignavibacteriota bacterium]